jgi:L-arabinokinase
MTLVFYISGHGFGHASRCLELIAALTTARPDLHVVARTSAPRSFLERSSRSAVEFQSVETDTGMRQIDSLRLDEDESAREAARFYRTFDDRVSREAAHLRSIGASLVVGDVPPLAFAAAAEAGLPSVALANFTWDWIYAAYPQFERIAPGVIDVIRNAYAQTTVALRLPLHGGFDPMRHVVRDIPFIARRSRRTRAEVRAALGLTTSRPVVLASFGAYGVDMPLDEIARTNSLALIVMGPDGGQSTANETLHRLTPRELAGAGLRYEDLVAASDVVVSKPGYGIVSECMANGTAFLYTSRDRFREYDVFVGEMPAYLRCRYISQDDLLRGRWAESIEALLNQPAPAQPDMTGAHVASEEILQRLSAAP